MGIIFMPVSSKKGGETMKMKAAGSFLEPARWEKTIEGLARGKIPTKEQNGIEDKADYYLIGKAKKLSIKRILTFCEA